MKKLSIALLSVVLVCLCGCMPQNTEIKYRLVIEGVGIDLDTARDEFIVTVQTAAARTGEEKRGSKCYTARGKTVAGAISALTEQTGRYPLYSQNRIILLGSSVTGENAVRALDFFVREYTSRPDVLVAAAVGDAEKMLTLSEDENGIAGLRENEAELSRDTSSALATELYEYVNLSLEEGSEVVLPLAEIVSEKEKSVKLSGSAVASSDNGVRLSEAETFFLLLATDKAEKGTLRLGDAALEIMKTDTKISSELLNGVPVMSLDVKMTVDVIEYGSKNFTDLDEDAVRELEAEAEAYITSGINELCERMLKNEKCDVFRLCKRLSLAESAEYGSQWRDMLPSVDVRVNADVRVGRIGQMTVSKQIEKK